MKLDTKWLSIIEVALKGPTAGLVIGGGLMAYTLWLTTRPLQEIPIKLETLNNRIFIMSQRLDSNTESTRTLGTRLDSVSMRLDLLDNRLNNKD